MGTAQHGGLDPAADRRRPAAPAVGAHDRPDRRRLGLPPGCREVSCVRDTGNTGNALPLLQLDRLMDRLAPGERALSVVVESSKWVKAGLALERPADPGEEGHTR
ncbi:hypothetical protein ACFQ51_50655 [Streptomyces kaempferi]